MGKTNALFTQEQIESDGKKKKKIVYIFKTGSPGVVWRYVLNNVLIVVAKQPVFLKVHRG